jgi:hypothetical protein
MKMLRITSENWCKGKFQRVLLKEGHHINASQFINNVRLNAKLSLLNFFIQALKVQLVNFKRRKLAVDL